MIGLSAPEAILPGRPADGETYHQIALPLTDLHYVRCGRGDPLIVLPATISFITDWLELVRFLGQYFETFMFELPGHGRSTPFRQPYSSELMAQSVEHLLDALELESVSLLSFSFGGIPALRTLHRLEDRIRQLILISPCVSPRSVQCTPWQKWLVRRLIPVLRSAGVQAQLLQLAHSRRTVRGVIRCLQLLGNIESNVELEGKLLALPACTLDVLIRQIQEIFTLWPPPVAAPFPQPCYLAMSVYDPMLSYPVVEACLRRRFANLQVATFTFPYHQPPEKLNAAQYTRQYGRLIEIVLQGPEAERNWSTLAPPPSPTDQPAWSPHPVTLPGLTA